MTEVLSDMYGKENLAKFDIPELDEALGGGVPRGSVVLLEEDTGTPSDALLGKFVLDGLRRGEWCYVVNTSHGPDILLNALRRDMDKEYIKKHIDDGKLILIDAFSNAYGWNEPREGQKFTVNEISSPKEVHDCIRDALIESGAGEAKKNTRGVIDSLSMLILAAELEQEKSIFEGGNMFEHLYHQTASHKNSGNCSIWTIHQGIHKQEVVKMLEHMADCVISLSRVDTGSSYRPVLTVEKMRDMPFSSQKYWLDVDEAGIKMTGLAGDETQIY